MRYKDKPRVSKALYSNDKETLTHAMKQEVQTLKAMQCGEEITRPHDADILPSRFILKRKRDKKGIIQENNARLVVPGSEED